MKANYKSVLSITRNVIDAELNDWLKTQFWPEEFSQALRHCICDAGKAFRPALLWATNLSFLEEDKTFYPSAQLRKLMLSVELMHTYSLIHDDLPSMDNDDFRRGRPTLHRLHGEAFAILSGDALLTASFQVLGEAFTHSSQKLPLALSILSKASGASGMIAGQYLDMSSEKSPDSMRTEKLLEKIHLLKTGALLGASTSLGALAAMSLNDFQKIEKEIFDWGSLLGLLFQISDDLLDQTASRNVLGKTPAKDLEKNKLTYALFMDEKAVKKKIEEIRNKMSNYPKQFQSPLLKELCDFVVNRSY